MERIDDRKHIPVTTEPLGHTLNARSTLEDGRKEYQAGVLLFLIHITSLGLIDICAHGTLRGIEISYGLFDQHHFLALVKFSSLKNFRARIKHTTKR